MRITAPIFVLAGVAALSPAIAQSLPPGAEATPQVLKDGSGNTAVGGLPAARRGDRNTGKGAVVEGSKNVFINGKPAARVGDRTNCGGVVVSGSSNVFVNGRPLARAGDLTTGCK